MKIYTNETDTIIAEHLADAKKVWEEHTGEMMEYYDDMVWTELPGYQELSISFVDDPIVAEDFVPSKCEITEKRDGEQRWVLHIKATVDEWIRAHGRGFLCSTEW